MRALGERIQVDRIALRNSARHRQDQSHRIVNESWNRIGVHTTLEAIAGVGRDSELSTGGANAGGIECGNLEKNLGCRFGHFAAATADDPRDGLRTFRISNHNGAGRKGSVDSVQRLDQLLTAGLPHDDGSPRDLLEIEGVHRLPEPE